MGSLAGIRDRVINIMDNLRTSFWVIPGALIALAIILSVVNVWFDTVIASEISFQSERWAWYSGIEGMRGILGTTAASILGVAGVSFSITIASLTLASQQFGPRLIRNFIRDRFTQTILGFFVATFVYCIMTMQLSDIFAGEQYQPVATLVTTLVLTIVDLIFLVLFIHHICVSIQVDTVIAEVSDNMQMQANSLFEEYSDAPETEKSASDAFTRQFASGALQARSPQDGYIRYIAYEALIETASHLELQVRIDCRAGDYVMRRSVLFEYINSSDAEIDVAGIVDECFVISHSRTQIQDLEYSIRQLVEIALRALSPGINDPFTAMTCIDRLGSLISLMAGKRMPPELMVDGEGASRLMASRSNFEGLVEAAFNQIRQNSRTHVDVTIRLLETLKAIISLVPDQAHSKPLEKQVIMIMQKVKRDAFTSADYEAIEERYEEALHALHMRQTGGWPSTEL